MAECDPHGLINGFEAVTDPDSGKKFLRVYVDFDADQDAAKILAPLMFDTPVIIRRAEGA